MGDIVGAFLLTLVKMKQEMQLVIRSLAVMKQEMPHLSGLEAIQ